MKSIYQKVVTAVAFRSKGKGLYDAHEVLKKFGYKPVGGNKYVWSKSGGRHEVGFTRDGTWQYREWYKQGEVRNPKTGRSAESLEKFLKTVH